MHINDSLSITSLPNQADWDCIILTDKLAVAQKFKDEAMKKDLFVSDGCLMQSKRKETVKGKWNEIKGV